MERKRAGATAFIFLISFIVFLPALHNGFVNWDDRLYVSENPNIISFGFSSLRQAFVSFYASNWHPLTLISLSLDYRLFGLNPWIYHFTNILLHALNASLVFLAAYRIAGLAGREGPEKGSPLPFIAALTTALLFGLHPLHVESVAWVSSRKDVLSAFFFLLSMICYLKYAAPKAAFPEARGRLTYYLLAIALFILSLMSKPMAISLPFILLILDCYPLGRFNKGGDGVKRALSEKIPFFILAGLSGVLTVLAQQKGGTISSFETAPVLWRVCVAFRAAAFYLYKIILPFGLAPFYPYPKMFDPFNYEYLGAIALFFLVTLICVLTFKKYRLFTVVWLFYLITLLPVSGIVQVGAQAAADRYTYIPSLSMFMLAGVGTGILFERAGRKWFKAALIILLIAVFSILCLLTIKQTAVWKDSVSLWTHEIKLYPDTAPLAYYNRGLAYQMNGELGKAIEDYDSAIALNGDYMEAYVNRGLSYKDLGDFQRAIGDFSSAVELDRNYVKAYLNRGFLYIKLGDYGKAISDFSTVISLEPGNAFAYYNLGVASSKTGEIEKADFYFKKASELVFGGGEGRERLEAVLNRK